mmetsp:Transcript_832/g.1493  ORF Transcript_832/g.1493 Transcript_832/m.1493 type:complete len:101 (-) Transcript_832:313-615(-)
MSGKGQSLGANAISGKGPGSVGGGALDEVDKIIGLGIGENLSSWSNERRSGEFMKGDFDGVVGSFDAATGSRSIMLGSNVESPSLESTVTGTWRCDVEWV